VRSAPALPHWLIHGGMITGALCRVPHLQAKGTIVIPVLGSNRNDKLAEHCLQSQKNSVVRSCAASDIALLTPLPRHCGALKSNLYSRPPRR